MNFSTIFKYAAFTGNALFILWILFNAMDEGFKGSVVEKASAVGLICLLVVNSALIINLSNRATRKGPINN